ncbi:hypothetical protein CPB83DRAFT_815609 [Crepidotus variabilis]|uniref:Uncharacterized protein n=1 Tax=Crepidotus variabilis TaxID=179855 RepID=A0A9P6JNZ0_9AGAR|nr:hypothetical protein CPB83DRAFT_815609 [Crepidotus variabilis]
MKLSLLASIIAIASSVSAAPLAENVVDLGGRAIVDFYDPRSRGGSLLDQSAGLGEPLNVIISGKSSPEVLTKDGFNDFAEAIGFSEECFGIHKGDPQLSDLGDGHGPLGEMEVLRENFGNPVFGTCFETLEGGNHLRVWQQNGPDANSGALFLAVSQEEDLGESHTISPDGYNVGRDKFVAAAVGTHRYLFTTYTTTAEKVPGLLNPGTDGINHGISQDGVVILLTVTVKSIF